MGHRDTADILAIFRAHYSRLYTSGRRDALDLDTHLADVALGWLGDSQREFLRAPFELDEIRVAIMQMGSGKVPGLDGLLIEFYKAYIDLLAPILQEVRGCPGAR